MQVILLERIAKLGQMGDVVTVKDGFARNFLLPQGKALRANKSNMERFEGQRAELEAKNLDRKKDADAIHAKLDGTSYIVIRSAGETGQLYGSVSTRDVAASLEEKGFHVARSQVTLQNPIKVIGLHNVEISLHPEVTAIVKVNVARSEDEAIRQAAGEDLTGRDARFELDVQEEDEIDLDDIFEEGAVEGDAEGEAEASEEETKS
jgi:large subunit ribosomal protein L9